MTLKSAAIRIEWVLNTQLGIDDRKLRRSAPGLWRYWRDLVRFRAAYKGPLRLQPCVHDWDEPGGMANSEYFLQDLLVARLVFRARPKKHVDIGSRVDGFVAHVASFREIEVFDVRPNDARVPGITFAQADFMRDTALRGYCDSVSCLHALEHFGLGRYGDPIDVDGPDRGLHSIARLLQPRGTLYLSVPVGRARVEFNAHRVFDPGRLVAAAQQQGLVLTALSTISGTAIEELEPGARGLEELVRRDYVLALFVFSKSEAAIR
jgi:SAM-dependent methyltransferase